MITLRQAAEHLGHGAQMITVADSLACAVRDQDADAIGALLASLATRELHALAVVLAERAGAPPRCRNAACAVVLPLRPTGRSYIQSQGYCLRCYNRWRNAGYPDSGPPQAMNKLERLADANAERRQERAERLAEFASYRRQRIPVALAARYVGVGEQTGYRYEAELRRQAGADRAA